MQEAQGLTEGDVMMAAETRVLCIKDEGKDHEPKECRQALKAGKGNLGIDSPWRLQEKPALLVLDIWS